MNPYDPTHENSAFAILVKELADRNRREWVKTLLARLTPSELTLARDIMYGKRDSAMSDTQRTLLLRIRRKAYALLEEKPLYDVSFTTESLPDSVHEEG